MVKIIFLEEFGKAFVPSRAVPHLRRYLLKAGITQAPYRFFGALFYVSLGITLVVYFLFISPLLQSFIQRIGALADHSAISLLGLSFLSVFIILFFLSMLFILTIYLYLD